MRTQPSLQRIPISVRVHRRMYNNHRVPWPRSALLITNQDPHTARFYLNRAISRRPPSWSSTPCRILGQRTRFASRSQTRAYTCTYIHFRDWTLLLFWTLSIRLPFMNKNWRDVRDTGIKRRSMVKRQLRGADTCLHYVMTCAGHYIIRVCVYICSIE